MPPIARIGSTESPSYSLKHQVILVRTKKPIFHWHPDPIIFNYHHFDLFSLRLSHLMYRVDIMVSYELNEVVRFGTPN